MRKYFIPVVLIFLCFLFVVAAEQKIEESVKIDEKVKEWSLKDTENKSLSLKKLKEEKKVILLIFLATKCPVVDDYIERINALFQDYKEKDVQLVGIHSNKHETLDEIKQYREKHKLEFPILLDPKNNIADYFNARRTPEVFVLNNENILLYRGAIDDSREKPKKQYLRPVLDLVLDGKVLPEKQKKTRAIGCTIKRVRKAELDRTP